MKKMWERKITLSKAKGRDWDIQFWQAQGADARFKAAWTMIIDFFKLRGERLSANKFRLQRTIENLKQV